MYRYVFLVLFLALNAQGSPLLLNDEGNGISLDPAVSYLEDPESQLQIGDVLGAQLDWIPNGDKTFNKSYNESSWWLKIEIDNPTARAQSRLLEISYPVLDYIDVYLVPNNELLQEYKLGDK